MLYFYLTFKKFTMLVVADRATANLKSLFIHKVGHLF